MMQVLVVDDDRDSLDSLASLVSSEGFETLRAGSLEEAREQLESHTVELVLCDLFLKDGRGTELLRELEDDAAVEVILVTGQASVETAVEALRHGAHDYLTKPVDVARLKALLHGVDRTGRLKEEVSHLKGQLRQLGRYGRLVGSSDAMQGVYDLIERVAPTDATVLVIGESGTGKELVAETIVRQSRRRDDPFLPLNCGAISPTLIESELFGHERGSFTGAEKRHLGCFERASGGTLFLDEITEMPVELQVKLLRVLETNRVQRVGGDEQVEVDVRVIAATNCDPAAAVKDGKLREDLYYRLQVFPIELPPLRERPGDIEVLSQHFLDEMNRGAPVSKKLSEAALEALQRYHWPGNVRELRNLLRRAFILADDVITDESLPEELNGVAVATGPVLRVRVGTSISEVEKRLILSTLDQLEGNKRRAAEALGISLKTLYNRLNAYRTQAAS